VFLARLSSSLSNFWIRALSQQLIRAARRSPLGSNGPGGPGKPQGDHSTGARGRGMSHPQERKSRKQQKWRSSTSTGAGKIERRCHPVATPGRQGNNCLQQKKTSMSPDDCARKTLGERTPSVVHARGS
jgi:hypothetical protein